MTGTGDDRTDIQRSAALCREAAELLTPNGSRRVRILLQMLLIELEKHAALATSTRVPAVISTGALD